MTSYLQYITPILFAVPLTDMYNPFISLQSSKNGKIGIAQNMCNGNFITDNTVTSNQLGGITADNQSQGGQVCHMLSHFLYFLTVNGMLAWTLLAGSTFDV